MLVGATGGPACAPLEAVTDAGSCVTFPSSTSGAARLGIRGPSLTTGAAAQSFKTTRDGDVAQVAVKLLAVKPTPTTVQTGQLLLMLQPDADGTAGATATVPSGSILGLETKTISDLALSTTVPVTVIFTVGSVPVEANKNYWIVIEGSYASSITNYVTWVGSTGDPFALGSALSYSTLSGGSWTNVPVASDQDQYFILGCN